MSNRTHKFDPSDTPTIPVWASTIRVDAQRDLLMIFGDNRRLTYGTRQAIGPANDLLAYRKAYYSSENPPPHHEFINACRRDLLLRFVERFGPVEAQRGANFTNLDLTGGLTSLSVKQSMETLLHTQERFRLLYQLIVHLQSGDAKLKTQIVDCCEQLDGLAADPDSRDNTTAELDLFFLDVRDAPDFRTLKCSAHRMVCRVFQQFPPTLVAGASGAVELPVRYHHSILSELTFMLRIDYLSGWGLSFCANSECRKPFLKSRSDARFCAPDCSQAQRQREYWHRTGAALRKVRRNLHRQKALSPQAAIRHRKV